MVCIREHGNDCIPPYSCFGESWLRRSYLSDSGSDAFEGALEGASPVSTPLPIMKQASSAGRPVPLASGPYSGES